MIKFTLKCSQNHRFDSWFKSGDAFEKLQASGLVGCPVCGETDIDKAIMAPRVTGSRKKENTTAPLSDTGGEMHALTAPASPAEAAIAELKKKIQKHSEYVGSDFVAEARAIHDGDAPERSIYGEAEASDAKKLLDDGVPVAPLPFLPTRKTN
ncbi:MAG: DUF1178 family protein [Paracoccaceae bacterium]